MASFASGAQQSAFTMLLGDNGSKRLRVDAVGDVDAQGAQPKIMDLHDAFMGVQGELMVWSPSASYVLLHRRFKALAEDLRLLHDALCDEIKVMQANNQSKLGALKFETAQTSARIQEVRRWIKQYQATSGGTETQCLQAEVVTLMSCCDFLEGAFTQITTFVTNLKNKVKLGVALWQLQPSLQACLLHVRSWRHTFKQ